MLLGVHVGLVAWLGASFSPNIDEPAHLAAGMAIWQYGSFALYNVNPPLMRAVATLPILFMGPETLWGDFNGISDPRPEFVLGAQFVESHPDRWRTFLVAARWALLPFSVVGGLCCYAWAVELFGRSAGLLALVLWCFSPNILTWSAVICTDGVATVLGVGAGYAFWRWLKLPNWPRALAAGAMLGLVQLSKMTWVPLFILWPTLWAYCLFRSCKQAKKLQQAFQLACILLLGLYLLNVGYGFEGSFTKLGEYSFDSQLFTGETTPTDVNGNPFSNSVLRYLPIPFPKNYLLGVDLQRADFEEGQPSYLFGQWSNRGWWYYYMIGLMLKTPLGTWGLAILAAAASLPLFRSNDQNAGSTLSTCNATTVSTVDQVVLLTPALMVVTLVSSQEGFGRHFRYVLPAMPFVFIWISKVAKWLHRVCLLRGALVICCLAWTIGSSLVVFPHSMSYFNELAGGPLGGHRYMLHSSFGWSQDDFHLKRWLEMHPDVGTPYICLERGVSLERLGLHERGAPPKSISVSTNQSDSTGETLGPIPGWHVISVQHIHDPDGGYLYFLDFKPVAMAGYSVYIYQITPEEANRVRRKLGLPDIRDQHPSQERLISEMASAAASCSQVQAALYAADETSRASVQAVRNATRHDLDISMTLLTPDDIIGGKLCQFEVLIVPGGDSIKQGSALGKAGRQAIRDFVAAGNGYVGICAGANLATTTQDWSLRLVNAQTQTGMRYVPGFGMRKASFRGWGTVQVSLTSFGQEILGDTPAISLMEYTGGPILMPANEYPLPDYLVLGRFRSEVWKYRFQEGTMVDSPAILAAPFGKGIVMLFSPHPDMSLGLESWLTRSIRASAKRGK